MSDSAATGTYEAHLRETVDGAAAVLAASWGQSVVLEVAQSFRKQNARSTVLRCRVVGGDGGALPATVIAKRFRGDDGGPYDPHDASATGPRARLLHEWAGTRFLMEVAGKRPFGPACYGGDARLGMVVLEDLGDGTCLADHLQGDDAARAEAALLAYATTLGLLHAATAGRHARFDALCRELVPGGADLRGWDPMRDWQSKQRLAAFRDACAVLGLPVSTACEAELARAAEAIADPGPFGAYTVGDTCPDNHRLIEAPDGSPAYLRFFDMEFGGFRHALLDAAYLWLPFPTCWCVNRLPEQLPPRLEAAYRAVFIAGCPAAADDRVFQPALVAACAVWLVLTVAWDFERVLEGDDDWGISTVRQRLPLRAENAARLCERHGHMPAFGALAAAFAAHLRERWGDAVEMPLYPPFRP